MKMNQKNRQAKSFAFKPFSRKQQQLIYFWDKNSPYKDCDTIIADGAIRSGKTIACICSFLLWSQSTFEGEEFIIAGKTIGTLKKNVVTPLLQIVKAWGWEYAQNRNENYIVIGSNKYNLYDANNERSQDRLQGFTAAGALCDEVALFPQNFVEQVVGRCSIEGSKMFFNCNPGNPYHYIKTEFVDKKDEKNIYYLHFTMDDNLSLSGTIKERYRKMFAGVFYSRYILGLWTQAEGVIYDMWDEKYLYDTLAKTFRMRRYIPMDYGTVNPMVFLDIYYDGDTTWIDNEYYYKSVDKRKQKTDSEYADDYLLFAGEEAVHRTLLDPSAASFDTALRIKGVRVTSANNDVLDGIRKVGTLMSLGKIRINKRCVNLLKELNAYIWDVKAVERGVEQPVKQNDHALDALRYFVNTVINEKRIVR